MEIFIASKGTSRVWLCVSSVYNVSFFISLNRTDRKYQSNPPSSIAFLTARRPSRMASLIWVMVWLLGPLTRMVTERGFLHSSTKVYLFSPWKHTKRKKKWDYKTRRKYSIYFKKKCKSTAGWCPAVQHGQLWHVFRFGLLAQDNYVLIKFCFFWEKQYDIPWTQFQTLSQWVLACKTQNNQTLHASFSQLILAFVSMINLLNASMFQVSCVVTNVCFYTQNNQTLHACFDQYLLLSLWLHLLNASLVQVSCVVINVCSSSYNYSSWDTCLTYQAIEEHTHKHTDWNTSFLTKQIKYRQDALCLEGFRTIYQQTGAPAFLM